MVSDSDTLPQFCTLDELIQVVYQGSAKFIVLSNVDEASWSVHVGLSGAEGRWWCGRWTDKDIRTHFASNSRSKSSSLESYAEQLRDAFVQGEMRINGWNSQKGAKMNLVLGTNTDIPANIALNELLPEEAASIATKIFTSIAVSAQSRNCRLHPLPFEHGSTSALPLASNSSGLSTSPNVFSTIDHHFAEKREASKPSRPSALDRKAGEEIQNLRAELAKAKDQLTNSPPNDLKGKVEERAESSRPMKRAPSMQDSAKLHSIASEYLFPAVFDIKLTSRFHISELRERTRSRNYRQRRLAGEPDEEGTQVSGSRVRKRR
ncbi:uncharacterized protein FIBRA_01876 [Fibroporia radiculosa]|uniref:Uncharacterized protein n=1 Tax=Fibroporia radiculosa TaxID=599839 RepID=J4HU10_9APHY|nr:uncharacterized protein FIBRA_01876 [Fibroporia radiculosa]CCL99852.1 predicted protein [Fibroporia radiculosa]